ncbi:type VII secretion-associated serine protease mycosin [Micromonospora sp. WMMD1128]|uniref:type VII secretion-associated serine protease mycosin n=1 Tax=unclassified Micromonospora TaxID=2617518 RepID=UPI00248C2FF8|nr:MULTISPECIES: type VII secretion-associated serine protease mycosin [unclassified Micromonospora]WBB74948.1 type VII secretion-associated serine protease mycosin [Micromonospora sp. WMMD1128]WFE31676.1 type VII secretion-associated serine protease mycosin [Micromonospora sp. WMMD975]
MRVDIGALRPVGAGLLAGLMLLGAAQPAIAAPRRSEQWYLDELRIDRAHQISTGRGVVVGVVDTGVDAGHPDLRGRLLAGGSTSGDGDGRRDPKGHGTHMAGIIAANGTGVVGVAPDARILPIRVPPAEVGAPGPSATGIRMAVDGGATVLNLSYGHAGLSDDEEQAAVRYALEHDVVVVSAVGNARQSGPDVSAPARYPGVIAVTGTVRGGGFWSGSAHGPEAVIAAPGDEVYNIGPEQGYGWGDGTSDSSAIVAGVAALIRSKYPKLSAPDVINRIIRTAREAGPPGRDPRFGFGRIDPVAALTADVPSVSANPLLGPTSPAASPPPAAAAEDDDFDVTRYGDRGGPTDQQVMVVGIGIAVALVVLVALVVFLIWNRRRHRREVARAGQIPDDVLDRMNAP